MLNKQGPGKIDWTDFSWNPISGCLHPCPYCYMKRMEKRFPGIMEPKFKPEYLKDLKSKKLKPGDKIFIGSSGDMWGEWNKKEWIGEVLDAIALRPYLVFQFLTKNPAGYWDWVTDQKNCWYGTTVDGSSFTMDNLSKLLRSTSGAKVRFVSFEPLLKMPDQRTMDQIYLLDWVIIGADSTRGAKKPPMEWADEIISIARAYGIPVFVKDNYGYTDTIKEFPK